MKRPAILATVVLSLLGILVSAAPAAGADTPVNRVSAWFQTSYNYDASGNSFTNAEVIGRRQWLSGLNNNQDGTGLPVEGATLTLDSGLKFERVSPVPVLSGPPSYQWSFGDVPEELFFHKRAWVGFNQDPITYTPGFDASRSASPTRFTASGTQTLIITATARQSLPVLHISVKVSEDAYVNPTITSPTTNPAQNIYMSGDRRKVFITIITLPLGIPIPTRLE